MNAYTKNTIIPKIKAYLETQPVVRAWLFGSYSRGEETENSNKKNRVFSFIIMFLILFFI